MEHCDALIVGGGPAGATSRRPCRRGLDVVVLDKADVSTPETLRRLDHARRAPDALNRPGRLRMRPGVASHDRLSRRTDRRTARDGVLRSDGQLRHSPQRTGRLPAAPLRCALDWVKPCSRSSGPRWVSWSTARLETPLLVAAGGHFCPVARLLGMAVAGREPVVAADEFQIQLTSLRASPGGDRPASPGNLFLRRPVGLRLVHSGRGRC